MQAGRSGRWYMQIASTTRFNLARRSILFDSRFVPVTRDPGLAHAATGRKPICVFHRFWSPSPSGFAVRPWLEARRSSQRSILIWKASSRLRRRPIPEYRAAAIATPSRWSCALALATSMAHRSAWSILKWEARSASTPPAAAFQ